MQLKLDDIEESQFQSNRHPKNLKRMESGEKHIVLALLFMQSLQSLSYLLIELIHVNDNNAYLQNGL